MAETIANSERRAALMLFDPFARQEAMEGRLKLSLLRRKPINPESRVASSSRLDVLHQGLDDDLVMLKERPTKGGAP